jgi:hypothetical protein
MSEHENKQLELAKGAHTKIIGPSKPAARGGGLEFIKDLLTGFGALFLFLFLAFICLPLLMIALKIGVVIAIPILYFGVFIICVALLGRLVRILFLKR